MNEINTKEQVQERFTAEVNRRRGGGATLTLAQARLCATRQLLANVKAREIDRDAARDFLIDQEIKAGSTPEGAKVYVEGLLDGTHGPRVTEVTDGPTHLLPFR